VVKNYLDVGKIILGAGMKINKTYMPILVPTMDET